MSAPDFKTCYQIEQAMESASLLLLSGSGVISYCASKETTNRETPAVRVRYNKGQATGHYAPMFNASDSLIMTGPTTALMKQDVFKGTLVADVLTDRSADNSYHQQYVGLVRDLFGNKYNFNSGSILPYHSVLFIEEQESSMNVDQSDVKDFDTTQLTFAMTVEIKPSAWPRT